MKKSLVYLIAIFFVFTLGATSFVHYSSSDYDSDTSSRSYNITVTIKGCKDMYCLDQCDTCWIAIYRYPSMTVEDILPYDGSCIYYTTVDASTVLVRLEWVLSCSNLFSGNGQVIQDVSIDPDVEIDPTCQ